MEKIEVGKIYKHYKGNIYKVIALGKHSETCEDMVIYQSIDKGDVWCRPLNMWFEDVTENVQRFTEVSSHEFK